MGRKSAEVRGSGGGGHVKEGGLRGTSFSIYNMYYLIWSSVGKRQREWVRLCIRFKRQVRLGIVRIVFEDQIRDCL